MDPDFSSRLRRMGVATPNPTHSNSSIAKPYPYPASSPSPQQRQQQQQQQHPAGPRYPAASTNPTLGVLEARRLLQERADVEAENPGGGGDGAGREFLDVGTLRQILSLRARGTPAAQIEARLRLKSGVVARLGTPGVVMPLADG